jgi:hypothetical protein
VQINGTITGVASLVIFGNVVQFASGSKVTTVGTFPCNLPGAGTGNGYPPYLPPPSIPGNPFLTLPIVGVHTVDHQDIMINSMPL